MAAEPGAKRAWLFEEEPYVVDGYLYLSTSEPGIHELDYDVVVLRDYTEKVPFRLDVIGDEEGYNDELAAFEAHDDETSFGAVARIENGEPYNFTLSIAADEFPEHGEYELQILFLGRSVDGYSVPNAELLFFGFSSMAYVQSERPRPSRPSVPVAMKRRARLDDESQGTVLAMRNVLATASHPPGEIHETRYFSDPGSVKLYASGNVFASTRKLAYTVFSGGELIGSFLLSEMALDQAYEVNLLEHVRDGEINPVQVIAWPDPFWFQEDSIRPPFSSNGVYFE